MCLAQGPQRSDAGEARTLGIESSTLPLSHCAPFLCNFKQDQTLQLSDMVCRDSILWNKNTTYSDMVSHVYYHLFSHMKNIINVIYTMC